MERRDLDFHDGGAEPDDRCGEPILGSSPADGGLDLEKRWLQPSGVDAEQFQYFYEKYHTPIFRFLYWKSGDYELAGDLTGDVFLEALDKLDGFSWQRYSFSAWLFQIARNVVRRHWRSRRFREDAEYERIRHQDHAPPTPEEEDARNRDREIVRMCLRRLGSDRQDVFVFHYWMGLTVRETAIAMKMGESNVKQHLSRGRRQMLKMIRDRGLHRELSLAGRRAFRELEIEDSGLRSVEGEEGRK